MSRYLSRCQSLILGLLTAAAIGCAGDDLPRSADESAGAKDSETPAESTVLFVGTSLTAGLGLDPQAAFPALIQQKIDSAGLAWTVINAGVSGETSAGALRRIDWLLQQEAPEVVIVETGANDGLRGLDVDSLEANLESIVTRLTSSDNPPTIVIAGMEALPNFGAEYGNRFRSIYPRIARDHDAVFLPFLLDRVAGNPRYNQADGIHPNREGARMVADNVWQVLGPLLDSLSGS